MNNLNVKGSKLSIRMNIMVKAIVESINIYNPMVSSIVNSIRFHDRNKSISDIQMINQLGILSMSVLINLSILRLFQKTVEDQLRVYLIHIYLIHNTYVMHRLLIQIILIISSFINVLKVLNLQIKKIIRKYQLIAHGLNLFEQRGAILRLIIQL